MTGDTGRGLELVKYAVENGFYPYEFIARHCPFLAPIRGLPEFNAIVSLAEQRTREFPE